MLDMFFVKKKQQEASQLFSKTLLFYTMKLFSAVSYICISHTFIANCVAGDAESFINRMNLTELLHPNTFFGSYVQKSFTTKPKNVNLSRENKLLGDEH